MTSTEYIEGILPECTKSFFVGFELSQHKHSLLYALSLPKRTRPYIRIIIKIKKNLSHILTFHFNEKFSLNCHYLKTMKNDLVRSGSIPSIYIFLYIQCAK